MDSYSNQGATYNKEENIPQDDEEKVHASFSDFFRDIVLRLSENEDRMITTREIAYMVGIDYQQFRKFVSDQSNAKKPRKTKKRDCIIAICAVTGCDATETNEALKLYGFPELDQYHRRDEIIWDQLIRHLKRPVSVAEINRALAAERYLPLDVHDYRGKKQQEKQPFPFKIVRRHFQCTIEGIGRRSDTTCFLDLQYDVDCFYNMRTCFEYLGLGRRFEICIQYEEPRSEQPENIWQTGIRRRICPKRRQYIVYTYPTADHESVLHEYERIDDTGEFRDCFLEIEETERAEKQRLYDTVDDTRNYGSRISAKVIDSELHIFCETYNSDIPELSEYYLMDFCGGEYTLYVLNRSCFMQMVLSPEKYGQVYGKQSAFRLLYLRKSRDEDFGIHAGNLNDPVLDQYTSEEDITDSAYAVREIGTFESYGENAMTDLRLKAYRQMKSEVDALIEKLKTGTAHICSRELLGDKSDSLIAAYFDLPAPTGDKAEYTPEQLRDAFELGLRNVDEISAFLQTNCSLKINEILSPQNMEGAESYV